MPRSSLFSDNKTQPYCPRRNDTTHFSDGEPSSSNPPPDYTAEDESRWWAARVNGKGQEEDSVPKPSPEQSADTYDLDRPTQDSEPQSTMSPAAYLQALDASRLFRDLRLPRRRLVLTREVAKSLQESETWQTSQVAKKICSYAIKTAVGQVEYLEKQQRTGGKKQREDNVTILEKTANEAQDDHTLWQDTRANFRSGYSRSRFTSTLKRNNKPSDKIAENEKERFSKAVDTELASRGLRFL